MLKKLILTFIFTACCTSFVSCDSETPEPENNTVQPEPTPDPNPVQEFEAVSLAQMKNANTDFAYEMLRKCYAESTDGNVCISPLSAQYAMSMLLAGADGDTQSEIMRAIGFDPEVYDAQSVNECMREIINELISSDSSITLNISNSIWLSPTIDIKPAYKETLEKYYEAYVGHADMQTAAGIGIINRWISEATDGLINNYFESTRDTVIALINALFLRANWRIPFISFDKPVKLAFATSYKEWIYVPSVYGFGMGYYGVDDEYKRVFLPLGDKGYGGLQVEIYMPTKYRLSSCIGKMTEARLKAIPAYKSEMPGGYSLVFGMPALRQDLDYDLIPIFKELGVETAFGADADFNRMSSAEGLAVGDITQKNTLKFTDWGVEAASVTSAELFITDDGQKKEELEFYVQLPYLYIIRDLKSGAILFMGTVTDLSSMSLGTVPL